METFFRLIVQVFRFVYPFFFWCLAFSFSAGAQENSIDCSLPEYQRIIGNADSLFHIRQYTAALKKYRVAQICRPEFSSSINAKIDTVYQAIQKERNEALANNMAGLARQEMLNNKTLAFKIAKEAFLLYENTETRSTLVDILREVQNFQGISGGFIWKYIESKNSPTGLKVSYLYEKEIIAEAGGGKTIAVSNDGKFLLSGGEDQTIRLWTGKGAFIRAIKVEAGVNQVAFSPDNLYILAACADGATRLWTIFGEFRQSFKASPFFHPKCASFSPDNQYIVTGSSDDFFGSARKTIKNPMADKNLWVNHSNLSLWTPEGKLETNFGGYNADVNSIAFSPDSKLLLTASSKGALIWSMKTKAPQHVIDTTHSFSIAAWSPDGQYVLLGIKDTVMVFFANGNLYKKFDVNDMMVQQARFSPDSRNILVCSSISGPATIYTLDGMPVNMFDNGIGYVQDAVFVPGSSHIVTADINNCIRFWSRNLSLEQLFTPFAKTAHSLALTPDSTGFLTSFSDSTARFYNLKGKELRVYSGSNNIIRSISMSEDQQYVLGNTWNGDLLLWQENGQLLQHLTQYYPAVFMPDSNLIYTSDPYGQLKILNYDGKLQGSLEGHKDAITSLVFSKDGHGFLTGSEDSTAILWNRSGNILRVLRGHQDQVTSVAISPDGRWLLTGCKDQKIRFWSWEGVLLRTLTCAKAIHFLGYSNDGKRILSVAGSDNVRIWDTAAGTLLQEVNDGGNSGLFLKDNKTFITSSNFGIFQWMSLDSILQDQQIPLLSVEERIRLELPE